MSVLFGILRALDFHHFLTKNKKRKKNNFLDILRNQRMQEHKLLIMA